MRSYMNLFHRLHKVNISSLFSALCTYKNYYCCGQSTQRSIQLYSDEDKLCIVFTVTSRERYGVLNHRQKNCVLNSLFSQNSASLALSEGNPPVVGGFPYKQPVKWK